MTRTLLLLALAACSGDDGEPTQGTSEPVSVELTVEPGPIAGTLVATVTTDVEASVQLDYGIETPAEHRHPQLSDAGTEHRFVVLGLKTDTEYTLEATALIDEGSSQADVTARTSKLASDVPSFSLVGSDPANTCHDDGVLLLTWIFDGESGVVMIDQDGDIVWSLPLLDLDVQANRSRPGSDGQSVVYTTADRLRIDLVGEIVVQPLDGSEPTVTSTPTAHHDFVQMAGGRLGWLGYVFDSYECEKGTRDNAVLDTIVEAEPGEAPSESTVMYDMTSDYPHELDCSVGSSLFLPGRYDLTHSNSLMYRESDDSYFHMLRWHDALVKVDRQTGDFQWQLGGTLDDFSPAAGEDPANLFSHAHMSDIWDGGMLVFDNNDPGPSWVREYALEEAARTWEQTFSWNTGGFELLLGDARRIPACDNLLVTLSTSGRVLELQRDGTVAWELQAEENVVIARVDYVPDIYDTTSAQLPD